MVRDVSCPRSAFLVLSVICLVVSFFCREATAQTQCDVRRDLHTSSICGLGLGMTPAQVLDIMKRPPDIGQEQEGDIVSGWKLPGGDFLSLRFRKKQYVSVLALDFHPARRATDLGLPTAFEDQYASGGVGGTALAGRAYPSTTGSQLKDNPNLKPTYHRDQTQNSENVVWYREETAPAGYKMEIGFYSASRLKAGERSYQNDVATKYVTIRKPELDKFDRAMESKPDRSATSGAKK
jgi:hypothetical protein